MACINGTRFEDYFANRVKQLTYTFPEDATTSNGTPFWSAPKRFPRPLQFSVDDLSHLYFIMAASVLRAETFGIPIPDWVKSPSKMADAVNKVIVPDFQPRKGVKIETDEKANTLSASSIDDAAVIDELIKKLEECQNQLPQGFKMNPIQFEKVSLLFSLLILSSVHFPFSLLEVFRMLICSKSFWTLLSCVTILIYIYIVICYS